jgi:hypothetical protein
MGESLDPAAARDRYVDFLRAASIGAVLFGHWLIGVIHWKDGLIRSTSAIGVAPGLWLISWVLQVMPIFFFAVGFSNLVTYRAFRSRGASTWSFIRTRFGRVLRPTLVFLGVWLVVQVALHAADIGYPRSPVIWGDVTLLRGMSPPGAMLPFGPLYFLPAYLALVAFGPLAIRLHRRFRWWVPAACLAGAVIVDVVGFGTGQRWIRFLNIPFALLLPHQLGLLYADGTLSRLPRKVVWAMALGGLGLLVVLTSPPLFEAVAGPARFRWFPGLGHYAQATVGTDAGTISNASPPTLPFFAVSVWLIGAVLLLREPVRRWMEKARPWRIVTAANGMLMTLFLWHMTAYLLAILLLRPLGLGRVPGSWGRWWLERPLWIGVPALITVVLVGVFKRFERPARRSQHGAEARPAPEPA